MKGSVDLHARLRLWSHLTPDEAADMFSAIADTEAQLKDIRWRIRSLGKKGDPSLLQAQKAELTQHLVAQKSLLSPIRSLPIEILTKIFRHCDLEVSIAFDQRIAPSKMDRGFTEATEETTRLVKALSTVLSQVCTTWNSILSLPSSSFAWSTISLTLTATHPDVDKHYEKHLQQTYRSVEGALARTGSSPLHVSINYREHGRLDCLGVMERLLQESQRWETAKLDLWYPAGSPTNTTLSTKLSSPMPLLHRLGLTFIREEHSLPGAFTKSPMLRHAVLNGIAFMQIRLPWNQLRSLEVTAEYCENSEWPDLTVVKEILSECSNSLHALTWSCPVLYTAETDGYPVKIPNTLLSGDARLLSLVPSLSMERLKAVKLSLKPRWGTSIDSRKLDPIYHRITVMHITTYQGNMESMVFALGELPKLRALTLRVDNWGSHFHTDGDVQQNEAIERQFPKLMKLSWEVVQETSADAMPDVLLMFRTFQQRMLPNNSDFSVPRFLDIKFFKDQLSEEHLLILRDLKGRDLRLTVADKNGIVEF